MQLHLPRMAIAAMICGALGFPPAGAAAAQADGAADRGAAVSAWVDSVFATGATPGMAVAVVAGDSVLLLRSLGVADLATGRPVGDATRFYVASTTKAFTALTAVILDRRRAVDLDASLAQLLPAIRLHPELSPSAITLRDLLAMRSGISGDGPVVIRTAYTGEFDTPLLLRLMRHHAPAESGRRFAYGNIGYNVAGLALEQATGRGWKELVQETVFTPLGMRETHARLSDVPADQLAMPHELVGGVLRRRPLLKSDRTMHAAGGHVSTGRDLARFLLAQLNGGRVPGTPGAPGVPAAAIAETHRRHVEQDRQFAFVHRTGWGLGWDIGEYRGSVLLQRNGSFPGYYSHLSFMPERRVGVAVVTNGGLGGSAAEAVAQGVYDLLVEQRDSAARDVAARDSLLTGLAGRVRAGRARADTAAPKVQPLPHPTGSYAGRFVDEQLGTLVLEVRGDSLVARMGDSWGVARPAADAADALNVELLGDLRRLTLRFTSDGSCVEGVTLMQREFRRSAGCAP